MLSCVFAVAAERTRVLRPDDAGTTVLGGSALNVKAEEVARRAAPATAAATAPAAPRRRDFMGMVMCFLGEGGKGRELVR